MTFEFGLNRGRWPSPAVVLRLRGRLYTARRFHRLMVWMAPAVVAISGGWITAETGRRP
ncbi:hypothetical protein [Streptomyces spiralis]|nr:hypothetical protein [Streptomyces spiralis]